MAAQRIVIIGGGPAGRVVVHALHKASADVSVTLIKDEEINVNRCAVPYGIDGGTEPAKYMIPNSLVTDFGAELVIGRTDGIDRGRKLVESADGSQFPYDKLVIATGSRPIVPPIDGVGLAGVTTVRSRDDMLRLRELAARGGRAVIVGAGYIGLEVAVELRKLGLEVTIVEMLPAILGGRMSPTITGRVTTALNDGGIMLRLGTSVIGLDGNDAGAVTGAQLSDGERLPADFVVLAIGVRPNADLADCAGLAIDERGGVVVDPQMRTSDPDIFAAGDCVAARSFIDGATVPAQFGTNAVFMGKVVAANLLGRDVAFPGVINAAASVVFDLSFGSVGRAPTASPETDVVGVSDVLDKYPMIPDASPIHLELAVERTTRKVVGAAALRKGHGVAATLDMISLAIQLGASVGDLVAHQYCTHPELAAKPSDNSIVFAALNAIDALDGAGS
jgi:NADH oxidase (H2O2-forming)